MPGGYGFGGSGSSMASSAWWESEGESRVASGALFRTETGATTPQGGGGGGHYHDLRPAWMYMRVSFWRIAVAWTVWLIQYV